MTAPTLPTPAATQAAGPPARLYRIALPTGLRLLNSNQRPHHHQKAKLTGTIRGAAMEAASENPALRTALAAANPGPVLQRAHIIGVYHPDRGGRCDPANWYPSFKAAVDGLVDAGVLEDDDHTRVVGPDMRIGRPIKGGRLVLFVRPVDAAEWADLCSRWDGREQVTR